MKGLTTKARRHKFIFFLCLGVFVVNVRVISAQMNLNDKQASHFVALALKCVAREFPNKPEHVINNAGEVKGPKTLHPAFYGCYDWHSSVHGHWMLIRLLKLFTDLPGAKEARAALAA